MQPDTYGYVREEAPVEERLEKLEPPKPKNNQNDTLYIKNIDEGCVEHTSATIRVSERWRDPETGRVVTTFKDLSSRFNHNEYFEVRWSGQPFRIPPGGVMKMPRYLGEHFASKLADHMLDKMGPEKMLRQDASERTEMLKRIIVKEEPFVLSVAESVGALTQQQVDQLNQADPVAPPITDYNTQGQKGVELGESDATPTDTVDSTVGSVRKAGIEPTAFVIKRLGTETPEDSLNVPEAFKDYTKSDLIKEIRRMAPDYKFGSTYTKAQLAGILQRF